MLSSSAHFEERKKNLWSLEVYREDKALASIIDKKNSNTWEWVAMMLWNTFGIMKRSADQCRQRWRTICIFERKRTRWSKEEERVLFSNQLLYGNKWKEFTKLLPGRTEYDIKNHFYCKLRAYLTNELKEIRRQKLIENYLNNPNVNYKLLLKLLKITKFPLIKLNRESIIYLLRKEKEIYSQRNKVSYCNGEDDCDFLIEEEGQGIKEQIEEYNKKISELDESKNKLKEKVLELYNQRISLKEHIGKKKKLSSELMETR